MAALAIELPFYFAMGIHVATVAIPLAWYGRWAARGRRLLQPTPPAVPTWAVPAEHRLICADTGAVLAAATIPVTMALAYPHDLVLGLFYLPVVAAAVFVMPRFVRAVLGQPWLRLTPEGVVVRGRHIAWEDVHGVMLGADPRPQLVIGARSRRPAVLHEAYVHANLLYLLDLVGYYAAHPERRVAIGRADEAERVTAALRGARLKAPVGVWPIPLPS